MSSRNRRQPISGISHAGARHDCRANPEPARSRLSASLRPGRQRRDIPNSHGHTDVPTPQHTNAPLPQHQCHPGIGDSRYPGSRTLVPGTTAVRIPSVRGPGSPLRYGRDDSAAISRIRMAIPTYRRPNTPTRHCPNTNVIPESATADIRDLARWCPARLPCESRACEVPALRFAAAGTTAPRYPEFAWPYRRTDAPTHQRAIAPTPMSSRNRRQPISGISHAGARHDCRANPERAGSRLSASLRPGRQRRDIPNSHAHTDVPTPQHTNAPLPQHQCHPGIGDSRYPGSRTLVPGTTAVRIPSVRGPGSPLRYGRDDSAAISRIRMAIPTYRRPNTPTRHCPNTNVIPESATADIRDLARWCPARLPCESRACEVPALRFATAGTTAPRYPEFAWPYRRTDAPTHQRAIAPTPMSSRNRRQPISGISHAGARHDCRANPEPARSRLSASLRPGRQRRDIPNSHGHTDVPTPQHTNAPLPQHQCHPGIGDSRYPGSRTLVPGTTAVRIPSLRGPGSPLRYGRDDSAAISRIRMAIPTHRRTDAPTHRLPTSDFRLPSPDPPPSRTRPTSVNADTDVEFAFSSQKPNGIPSAKKPTSKAVQITMKTMEYGTIISSMSPKPSPGRYLRMKARMTPA
jgi:hypothetical protein